MREQSIPIRGSETSARTSPSSLSSDSSVPDPRQADSWEDGDCSDEPLADIQNDAPLPTRSNTPTASESPPSERSWKKRFIRGEIPDSREASTGKKSALENAMRRCRDRFSDAIVEPEIGMELDSLPEAYDFYNIYSWDIGFGIRYGSSRLNPAKSKVRQDITCGCEGSP